ncbi:putative type II and type III secretion system protein precursor [Ralstonia phage RsoP1IDN]|uniref:Putative type II and type III secretion system protein n=1 Tax=Ralstonia phage RsoP1IDN TaxID=2060091 RepID=A0A2P0VPH8_9CAUD|nr:recombinase [Ralstonia phage RsoP1IDN]AUG85439.1 putative type II and type III secretion system protein precursor [Ralstonia phage RsoP1IDN]
MEVSNLLSPGQITLAYDLRDMAARAISEVQVAKQSGANVAATKAALAAFFSQCAAIVADANFAVPAAGTFVTVKNGQLTALRTSTLEVSSGSPTRNSPATIRVAGGALSDVVASA